MSWKFEDVCIVMKKTGFFLSCLLVGTQASAATVTTAAQDRALFAEFTEQQARAKVCLAAVPGFAEQFGPALRKWRRRNEQTVRLGDAFARTDAPAEPDSNPVAAEGAADDAALPEKCKAVLSWLEGG